MFLWGGGIAQAPISYAIYSSPTVLWAEVEDASKGKAKVIFRENANFGANHLEAITTQFLNRYVTNKDGQQGSPTGKDRNDNDPLASGQKGERGQSTTIDKGGDFGFFPFGNPFDLNINIPNWIWLIGAGLAGMKFLDTTNKAGKIAYGGIATLCTINYLNKSKIPLPFKIPGILGEIPEPPKKRLLL